MRNLTCMFVYFLVLTQSATVDAQLVVAHRGASFDAPENTLAAFSLAWKKHADAIEGDFYVTKDQQIVCIHDKTTKRLAPRQPVLTVANSTLAELKKLDVGSWKHQSYSGERIPTLKEVLATVPDGKQVLVEIKCGVEILPLLKPQLKASGLEPDQIVIICFSKAVVTEARRMMPEYNANWLTSYKQKTKQSEWKPTRQEVLTTLNQTGATGLGTNANLKVVDQLFVDSIRDAGFEFHTWTINDVDAARKVSDLGALSITTDRPELIRNAIQLQPVEAR